MRITLKGGGFHNVKSLPLNIKAIAHGDGVCFPTQNQIRKIKKHFCGVSGCKCNSGPVDSEGMIYLDKKTCEECK